MIFPILFIAFMCAIAVALEQLDKLILDDRSPQGGGGPGGREPIPAVLFEEEPSCRTVFLLVALELLGAFVETDAL